MSRRVLFIRLARWKWNHKIKMTGFVSDVVTFWKIINSWTICWNLFQQIFSQKTRKLKQEKIEKMSTYISIQKSKQRAKSPNGGFSVAKEYLKHLLEITNVVRLLCGSYKIRGNAFLIQLYTQMFVISAKKGLLTPSTTRCYIVQAHMMRGKICGIG